MWVLIDNYDSFTHILWHYLSLSGHECIVLRNDALSVADLAAMQPERIILSPGPQTPYEAGITLDVIDYFHTKLPILGVCLGHQALAMYFNAPLLKCPLPMHGKTSSVRQYGHPIFQGIGAQFEVMRYHSLCVDISNTAALVPIATAEDDGVLMALAHKELPLFGLQFHPESIGTPEGQLIIDNWAKMNL